jgi:hypothetical protein
MLLFERFELSPAMREEVTQMTYAGDLQGAFNMEMHAGRQVTHTGAGWT